jgi:periplasmic copper chaperone A
MSRPPASAFVAVAVAVVGFAGLIRGAVPQAASGGLGGAATDPIVVSGAYVREPASPDVAAAYFTVYNTTGTDDTLTSVASGAGESASVMTEDASGGMRVSAAGLRIPAHSSVTLKPGTGHVMIERLVGTLRPGQYVNLELNFVNAGPVNVSAPVIAINAEPPR